VPQASIRGLNMFAQPKAAITNAWNVIVSLLKAGAIKPIVARTFPLEEAAAALRYLIEGRPFGRVVLTIGSASNGPQVAHRKEKQNHVKSTYS
jgi:NADPH2:quinone reductase